MCLQVSRDSVTGVGNRDANDFVLNPRGYLDLAAAVAQSVADQIAQDLPKD